MDYESQHVQTSKQYFDVQSTPRVSIIPQHEIWTRSQSKFFYEVLIYNKNLELLKNNPHLLVEYSAELQVKEICEELNVE